MVRDLAGRYGLEEATREVQLQGATLAFERKDYATAWSTLQTAKTASAAGKDAWREGRALTLMGQVKLRQGEFPEAAGLLREALLRLREARAGRDPVRTEALIALGTCLVYMGRAEDGLRQYQQAASSTAAQRNPSLMGQALWGMGWAYRKRGNLGLAREMLLDAKACMEKAEELPDLMWVLHNLGQLLLEEGRTADALRHFHQALRVMDRLGKPDRAPILTEIARAHLHEHALEEAEDFAAQALQSAQDARDPVEHAEAQLLLARVHLLRGRMKKARPLLDDALTAFRARGMEERATEALHELGLLLRQEGAHAEAASVLALAIDARPKTEVKKR
jgi:tetratricopeptide (TPR) repeat protein